MDRVTHDLLSDVQALLGPGVPSGDIAKVFALALECLKTKLLKQKAGKCERPRARRGSEDARYVPDEVKRVVWDRDGGQCAFVGTGGRRCDSRDGVQYDHVQPVARGGESTVANVRLLCHAHNQFEAERVLGAEFMEGKREAAKSRSKPVAMPAPSQELVPRLLELGLSAEQAAQAAARCGSISGVPFEERLTLALRGFAPAAVRLAAGTTSST